MRIGLLTYYGDLNCGTNLQAYATLKAVKNVFPEDNVEIIPFHGFTPPDVKPYFYNCSPFSLYRDCRRILGYKRFVKCYLGIDKDVVIKDPKLGLDYLESLSYDRIYVGADTLLELDRIPKKYDGLSAYWLSPKIPSKKYLISASSKNVSYDSLTDKQREDMRACVLNYDGITVRDKSSYSLITRFVDESKVKIIPDPTFTLEIDYRFTDNYIKRRNLDLSNTICLHPLKDDKWTRGFARLLKKKGYKVASFRPAYWADIELNDMTPLEQLGIYRYFVCFITHRFHDTVFCIKNNCPVISYPVSMEYTDKNGNSKYSTLLDHFGLKDLCLVTDRKKIVPLELFKQMERVILEYPSFSESINVVINEIKQQYMDALFATK